MPGGTTGSWWVDSPDEMSLSGLNGYVAGMALEPQPGYERLDELVAAVDDDVRALMERHFERRDDWYFHEFVPWE